MSPTHPRVIAARLATAPERARFVLAAATFPAATDGGAELEAAADALHSALHSYDEGVSEDFAFDSGLTEIGRPDTDRTALLEALANFGCAY